MIFEERDGEPRHLASVDDFGEDGNAEVGLKLVKERRYFIRVRAHYVATPDGIGLLVV